MLFLPTVAPSLSLPAKQLLPRPFRGSIDYPQGACAYWLPLLRYLSAVPGTGGLGAHIGGQALGDYEALDAVKLPD